ncbi:MAG TPA: type II toxin-antitoxin system HicA family toxin [Patescibacteria group bacterium]|nr:type II toxin-antitoxin system HicA family toxin [Patescibacteria group bacterium]
MSTGVPRDYAKVVKAAKELGYEYSYSTGGHDFFVHPDPDKDLKQAKKLTIPTEIKGTGTLRSILKGMGYFEANNLDFSGQPKSDKAEREAAALAAEKKVETKFITDVRGWKKEMHRHFRGIVDHPGEAPAKPAAAGMKL